MSGKYRKLTDSHGTTIWPVTTTSAIVKDDLRVPLDYFLREFNLSAIYKNQQFNLNSALEILVNTGQITFQKGDRVKFENTSGEIEAWEMVGQNSWIKIVTDAIREDDPGLVPSGIIYTEINRIETVTEIALNDLKKTQLKDENRIRDLEDGYESVSDDIERIENNTKTELDEVKEKLKFDETPTENSTNAISSGGVYVAVTNLSQIIEDNEEVTAAALVDLDKRLKDSNGVAADIQDHLNVVEEVTEKSLIDLNSKIEKINSLTYSDIDNIV